MENIDAIFKGRVITSDKKWVSGYYVFADNQHFIIQGGVSYNRGSYANKDLPGNAFSDSLYLQFLHWEQVEPESVSHSYNGFKERWEPFKKGNGDLIQIDVFINTCEKGGFINYDGFAMYSDGEKVSNIEIRPSDVVDGRVLRCYSHVVWYNR